MTIKARAYTYNGLSFFSITSLYVFATFFLCLSLCIAIDRRFKPVLHSSREIEIDFLLNLAASSIVETNQSLIRCH